MSSFLSLVLFLIVSNSIVNRNIKAAAKKDFVEIARAIDLYKSETGDFPKNMYTLEQKVGKVARPSRREDIIYSVETGSSYNASRDCGSGIKLMASRPGIGGASDSFTVIWQCYEPSK